MADRWFYGRGNDKLGPFSAAELRQLADNGQLRPTDTVWKEGIAAGVVAGLVGNLFAPAPAEDEPGHERSPHTLAEDLPEEERVGTPDPSSSGGDSEALLSADSREGSPPEAESPAADEPAAAPAVQPAAETHPAKLPPKKEKAMVTTISGAILLSQDGKYVQFRKKCRKCGFEDRARTSLPIKNGVVRQAFFCPKCRKPSDVEIRGRA